MTETRDPYAIALEPEWCEDSTDAPQMLQDEPEEATQ